MNPMGTTTSAISSPATGGGQRRQPCAKGGEWWKVVGERKSNQWSDAEEGKGGERGVMTEEKDLKESGTKAEGSDTGGGEGV